MRDSRRMAVTHRTPIQRIIEPDAVEREGAGFDLQMRGYAREQVEQRIHEWATAYDALELERDQLLTEITDLRARPQQLSPLSSMSARVTQIVEAAEAEAADLQASAQRVADSIVVDAREAADADLEVAAHARADATVEADRMLIEARQATEAMRRDSREAADRLVLEAQAEAEAVRAAVRGEQEQILSAARADAAELERTTAYQREKAEAEHQRLLAAHTSQQKRYAADLRAELADLQRLRDEAQAEVDRLRQMLSVPGPAAAVVPSALAEPAVDDDLLADFMHTGNTGENDVSSAGLAQAEPPSHVEPAPHSSRTAAVSSGGDEVSSTEPAASEGVIDLEPVDDAETAAIPLRPVARRVRRGSPARSSAGSADRPGDEPITGELPRD